MRPTHLMAAVLAATSLATVATTASASTTTTDPLLGAGLSSLVNGPPSAKRVAPGFHIDRESLAIRDASGRVLVDLTPQDGVDAATYRASAEALGFVVQAVDSVAGTLEGFAPVDQLHALATLPGTGTLAQAYKPRALAANPRGAVTTQGVGLQRADRVQAAGITGKGITVAAISDSYDAANLDLGGEPLSIHAAQDVASGDLPGKGNASNSQPVVDLDDLPRGDAPTDEGRGMLQLVHDVAPGAKLCFATGSSGQVAFAANVRRLADKKGACGADVIVDDLGYFDEPFFGDSIIGDAIDEVAADGVHYFSAEGNDGESAAWGSPVSLVPPAEAVKGSGLDFRGVDPALYSGGLQDMDPGPGVDVDQTIDIDPATNPYLDLQWDDPLDADGVKLGDAFYSSSGSLTASTPERTFTFTPKAAQVGRTAQFKIDGVPSGSVDLVLSVSDPSGKDLGTIDSGSSPEVLVAKLTAGAYTITVTGFDGATGPFTVGVRDLLAPSRVSTDFNALLFDEHGGYLGALADENRYSGKPLELGGIGGLPRVQLVIARAGTGPVGATRLRTLLTYGASLSEFENPLAPAAYGHPLAKGATGVAAYDPFKPYLPEPYTSPGGLLPIVFDSAGNRYPSPQLRQTPQIAATDGGNTTFFGGDTSRDDDTLPNFFGTSAAAPHAAGIAALALQAAGGPRSVTPAALRSRMQSSAYVHDLDPLHAEGSAGGLTISADGEQGEESGRVPGSLDDPRFFTVQYSGAVPLKTLTLYGETGSPTALGTRKAGVSDGIVFDRRPFALEGPLSASGSPYTLGAAFGGLVPSTVRPSYSVPGGGVSAPGQFRHLTLDFAAGLPRGQGLRFGVDRDLATTTFRASIEGNGADELGGATLLPERTVLTGGVGFYATRADGTSFTGQIKNRLGRGFSPVDGHGVVDAEQLVLGK